MSEMKNIKSRVLSDKIADDIINYIQTNHLVSGQKIPNETTLCEMFEVSRSTIREAVKNLSSKGVLQVKRGDGTYILRTYINDLDPMNLMAVKDKLKLALDLVDVRLMLEPEIAALAAKNASEDDVNEITNLCNITERLINSEKSYVEFDIAFHTAIAKASKNVVIKELIPIIDTAVMMFVNVTHKKLTDETITTHRMITKAIQDGDMEGAKGAMHMHLTFNRNMIKEIYKKGSANLVK